MLEWKTPNVGFDKLLSTDAGRQLFGSFLEKEFSSENLKFWIACEQLKEIKEASQFSNQVEAIFNNYIDPSALDEVLWSFPFFTAYKFPPQISLKGCVKESLHTKKENPPRDIFEAAQSDTYSLMHMDSFPRYLAHQHININATVIHMAFYEVYLKFRFLSSRDYKEAFLQFGK